MNCNEALKDYDEAMEPKREVLVERSGVHAVVRSLDYGKALFSTTHTYGWKTRVEEYCDSRRLDIIEYRI